MNHFITLKDIPATDLRKIVTTAKKRKDKRLRFEYSKIKKFRNRIKFVYQNSPRGTGDAILKCKKFIKSTHFLMLLPDDLILKNNCSLAMIKLHKQYNSSIIASKKVKTKDVTRWGFFKIEKLIINNYILLNMSLFIKLLQFLNTKKKYWLYPIIFFFALFGLITYFFQGSMVPPWIYTIF